MKKRTIQKVALLIVCFGLKHATAQLNFNLQNNAVVVIQNGCNVNILGNVNVDNTSKIKNEGSTLSISGTPVLNGTVEYAAAGNQTIINAAHGTLVISGSGNKTLSGNTDINTNLTLGGTAKLITGTNVLTLKGSSSTITGAAFGTAATSWVVTGNGGTGAANTGIGGFRVENTGSGGRSAAVLFPTGPTPTAYNPARLTNTGTQDNFLLKVSDQQPFTCQSNQCVNRTWDFSEAVAGGTSATIDLQFNSGEQGAGINMNAVAVAHYIAAGINREGPVQNISAQSSPYTVTGAGAFYQFSPYGLSSTQSVVAIKLISFGGGINSNDDVELKWTAENAADIQQYIIERSTDGIHFNAVGYVNPVAGISTYRFTDTNPAEVNYYRLTMISNTETDHSIILKIELKNKRSVFIYPVPVYNYMILETVDAGLLQTTAEVFTADGKLYQKLLLKEYRNLINTEKWNAGLYFIRLLNGRTYKIIKN